VLILQYQKQLPNCPKIAKASISALSNASSVIFNAYTPIFVFINMNQVPEMIQ
jgi:hypothetical protein